MNQRIRHGTLLALGREPSPAELETLSKFAAAQIESFRSDPTAAHAIAPADLIKMGLSEPEGSTLVSLARVLINTDNFITRE